MIKAQTSIDPEQVRRFGALAGRWWDPAGPFWPLHRLNALRADWIRDRVCAHFQRDHRTPRPLRGLDVLDVGCGGGLLSEAIAAFGAHVHGVDVVERNIAIARLHAAKDRDLASAMSLRYEVATAEELAAASTGYDLVLNMEVVEHVADLPVFLHACNRLVRPGGMQVIATLNRTARSFLFAIVGAEYVLRWLPRATHDWRRFPTPAELEALLATDNLHVRARAGVRVNPFDRRFALTESLAVNYMLAAARPPHG